MSSLTTSRRTLLALLAVVAAYALTLGALPAGAQTETTTTQAPTETTPTETTPTTTPEPAPEPEPEPAPEPTPEQTAAPNEYSESVPTGSGTAPTSPQGPTGSGSSQPSTIVSTDDLSADDSAATGPAKDKKKHASKKADKKPHERVASETPATDGPSVPAAPAASDVGDSARLLWLGLALLMITGGIVSTALARRRRANL